MRTLYKQGKSFFCRLLIFHLYFLSERWSEWEEELNCNVTLEKAFSALSCWFFKIKLDFKWYRRRYQGMCPFYDYYVAGLSIDKTRPDWGQADPINCTKPTFPSIAAIPLYTLCRRCGCSLPWRGRLPSWPAWCGRAGSATGCRPPPSHPRAAPGEGRPRWSTSPAPGFVWGWLLDFRFQPGSSTGEGCGSESPGSSSSSKAASHRPEAEEENINDCS